ncbi:MAG: DUF3298 and DUF4163 domain-containing protein [Prevotellaceae bacterium]|jgi:hypothetical protein|nr:DUF3298 and DUF4163 domain-containing protein [Prevotellaceae bacterium]
MKKINKMNKLWQCLVAIVFIMSVFACKTNNKFNIEVTSKTVADSSCNYTDDTTINNVITINYLEAKCVSGENCIAETVNQDFFTWLKQFFFVDYNDTEITKDNLKDAVASEIKAFIKDVNEDESLADCESCRYAELSVSSSLYQNSSIISSVYMYYQYSGGAHGGYGCTAFNYSKKDGTPITVENLSTNIDELTAIAEKAFVEQNGEITDYWFEDNKFYLPDVFFFTENKIEFYYNLYEIASYAAGAIVIELNNDDVKHLIDYLD